MKRIHCLASLWLIAAANLVLAQSRLPTYPGYEQYQKMSAALRGQQPFKSGALTVTWSDDSKGFDYQWDGKSYHYDLAGRQAGEVASSGGPSEGGRGAAARFAGAGAFGRGGRGQVIGGGGNIPGGSIARRLSTTAVSPDKKYTATSRDNNVYIEGADGGSEIAVTTDGNTKSRISYGYPTIVYGEELGMAVGMWWSPDSKKLAYYRFDNSKVEDYVVALKQTAQYDSTEIDSYPKAGMTSPVVDLYIYDLDSKKTTQLDVRDGKPFEDKALGYYVYRIAWTHDGNELLFSRMNRRQNTLELCAADPQSGKCRVIVREEWPANWTDWAPGLEYLKDHQRFIWTSERNGFKNLYLYDLSGKLLATLTHHDFDVAELLKIDESAGAIYYMARDGDNHMKLQLHRVGLDGSGDKRLTDPAYYHSVTLSPDNKYFVDVIQTHDMPPATRLVDDQGNVIGELAQSDASRLNELGLKPTELFTFKTLDGTAELHGMLNFPSHFDPNKKYPLLVSVYGGPNTSAARETYWAGSLGGRGGGGGPELTTEYGFLVASFDARSLSGRGRKFSDPFYEHLGIIEMDDQAAGVKALDERPYVDKNRVGVFGTSYGGTSAATLIMRYPDLFQAACSCSPVTDYRNYNCIYAERNEGLVSENKAGYDAATVMTYAPNLKGRLLLYYGTADNNVHPSNAMQLIAALQRAGKSFEVQVGPDQGHGSVNRARMMEFFIENLVLNDSKL
jgi:dipeptidyl-peptidase-4